MIKDKFHKKAIHIAILSFILVMAILIVALLILKYSVEGETNLPFNISKIVVVSSAQTNNGTSDSAEIIQKNDIYVSIEKNANYKKEDAIKSVKFNNFQMEKYNSKGTVKLYRPSKNTDKIYEYQDKYVIEELEYLGGQATYLKGSNLEISNQGGIAYFSICVDELGQITYAENENFATDGTLLKKINLKNEDVEMTVNFDIIIELASGKTFKSTSTIELPVGDLITEGVCTKEIDELVFKRI